jgi:DNA mismatch repair protein MutL
MGGDTAGARESAAPEASENYGGLRYLGQYSAAYLVCEDGEDLVLIDQHAAHERVAFERLRKEFHGGGVESQGLLFPETINLTHQEAAVARANLPELQSMGFVLEEFGGTAFRLVSAPRLIPGDRAGEILLAVLADLVNYGRSMTFADHLDELLATIACHSVVRGVAPLTSIEVKALLLEMDATDFSANCPHGRPVIARIPRRQIDRMFGRA